MIFLAAGKPKMVFIFKFLDNESVKQVEIHQKICYVSTASNICRICAEDTSGFEYGGISRFG